MFTNLVDPLHYCAIKRIYVKILNRRAKCGGVFFFCYASICICTLCADAFMLCHTLQLFLLLQGLEERSARGTRPITDAFSKTASAVKSSVIFV